MPIGDARGYRRVESPAKPSKTQQNPARPSKAQMPLTLIRARGCLLSLMTFGFPAYHEDTFDTPLPVTEGWIAHVCGVLGWSFKGRKLDLTQGMAWRIEGPVSIWAFGTNLLVRAVGANRLQVRSECALPTQCVDWGANARNTDRFRDTLRAEMAKEIAQGLVRSRGT